MKSIMEQWRRNVVSEGITDVVFHKTRLDQAAQIMQNNKFMTSVAFGTPAEKEQNKGKLYYLSTARSPTSQYSVGLPSVTFKLDGRKLGQRSKAAAIDYWGPDFPTDEMEDRVFTDEPYLEPATDYITEVHIGMVVNDIFGNKSKGTSSMSVDRLKEAEAIAAIAESQGIPVYFYSSAKTYGILNKTKRLTLDQWKAAFKKGGQKFREPWGYKSEPYVDSILKGTIEILKALESGNTSAIEKGHGSVWYKIKYQYGGEWARRIQNAVHNSKSKPEARDYISVLGKQIKKYGGLDAFVEWLQGEIKKDAGEQELRQVAERHGFLTEGGMKTLYHIGKRPPQPKPKRSSWNHKPGDEKGWDRPQHSQPVEAGVFLSPNPIGIAQNHGIFGHVYAYDVSNGLISKAGGMQRYDWGTEVLIPEDIWQAGIDSGEIKFLGKSMDYNEFVKKADQSKGLGDRLATTKRRASAYLEEGR
tara:strand:+ start:1614 stop:3029 length:1416 start_codon:yes stop_codon:yes gene_type:complete